MVGAGPAGLAMARALKVHGMPFDVYERHRAMGGIWDQSNPGSPVYNSTHFISSKTQSSFLDFEMPGHYPDYPSHRQILAYLRAFARAYDLQSSIRFNTHVEHVAPSGRGWSVRLSSGGHANMPGWLPHAAPIGTPGCRTSPVRSRARPGMPRPTGHRRRLRLIGLSRLARASLCPRRAPMAYPETAPQFGDGTTRILAIMPASSCWRMWQW